VLVEVHGDAGRGMPEAFAGDLNVYAVGQHLSRVGMPQVMEPAPGQPALLDCLGPLLGNPAWMHQGAVRMGADQGVLPDAELEQSLGLRSLMCS